MVAVPGASGAGGPGAPGALLGDAPDLAQATRPQPTIFVSIPSYRDPECQYTVLDLFRKAQNPERIRVGVCWQSDREQDARCFLLDLGDYANRIKTVFLHHSEARGPCYARALIQQNLFGGEDYYLQLDSHYRMIKHWDAELLTELASCRSEKPILTTYPSSYTLPDDYLPGGPDRAELHSDEHPIIMCAREFGADGFLRTVGKACCSQSLGGCPAEGLFWAAGFAFSASTVVREVPYDRGLEDLFFGEEQAMAARLWTSGWDFFAPTKVIGYHLWTRKHRPVFREHASEAQRERESRSQKRVRELLCAGVHEGQLLAEAPGLPRGTAAPCGLGSARSMASYEAFCGISHAVGEISQRARRGGLRPSCFIGGDPAAPSVAPGASPEGLRSSAAVAAILGAPVLGLMPSHVAQAIQLLAGAGLPTAAAACEEHRAASAPSAPDAADRFSPLSQAKKLLERPPRLLQLPDDGAAKLALLRKEDVETLNAFGFVVLDNFLRDRCYASCGQARAADAPAIVLAGSRQVPLRPARLGRGEGLWSSSAVRGDEMAWLSAPQGQGLRERAQCRVLAGIVDPVAARSTSIASTATSLAPTQGLVEVGAELESLNSGLPGLFGGTSSGCGTPAIKGTQGSAGTGGSPAGAGLFCDGSTKPREGLLRQPSIAAGGTPTKDSGDGEEATVAMGNDRPFYKDLDVLLAKVVELREELDSVLSFGSVRTSFMLARYPGSGARYARHRDALPDHVGDRRRLTAVYYLNVDWKAADGGCLRLYLPEELGRQVPGATPQGVEGVPWLDSGSDSWALDVEPQFDRLLLFASGWLEHEVLPTHTERYAITTWFY